jgi:hypothetical protein
LSLTMQNFLRFHTAWTRRRHRLSEQRRRQCNPERTLRESSCSSLTRRSRPHKAAAWEDDPSRCPTKTSRPPATRLSGSSCKRSSLVPIRAVQSDRGCERKRLLRRRRGVASSSEHGHNRR